MTTDSSPLPLPPPFLAAIHTAMLCRRTPEWGARWNTVIGRLEGLSTVEADWDGQGAAAPDPVAIRSAVGAAMQLRDSGWTPPDSAYATPAGTVLLAWHCGDGAYLEAEALGSGDLEWMHVEPGQETRHWTGSVENPSGVHESPSPEARW